VEIAPAQGLLCRCLLYPATVSPRRPEKPAPVIVKRPSDERKKLPPELEAFARSQDEKLRVKRPRVDQGRINDPREGYVIAGVSNRDARAVYDARAASMRALWADGQADEAALTQLSQLLHEAQRLTLWRARRITGFDALAEQVVGIRPDRAQQLVDAWTEQSGESAAELNERTVAVWLRIEAGLYEGDESVRVHLRGGPQGERFELSVRLSGASAAFAGAGARHAPLAREAAEAVLSRESVPAKVVPLAAPQAAPQAAPPAELDAQREAPSASSDNPAGEDREVRAAPALAPLSGGAKLLTRKRPPADAAVDAAPARPARAEGDARRASFGRKHGAEGERAPRVGDHRGFQGGRDAERGTGEKRTFGNKAGFGEKRTFGDKADFGEKRSFGAKRPFGRDDGEQRAPTAARDGAGFGEKRGFAPKRGFGDKREPGDKRDFGNKTGGFKTGGFNKGGFNKGGFNKGGAKQAGFGAGREERGQKSSDRGGDRPRFEKRGGEAERPARGAGKGPRAGFGAGPRGKKPFSAGGGGKRGFSGGAGGKKGGFSKRETPRAERKARDADK
jgi:hypothetical protein